MEWLKKRIENILDNAIFASLLALGGAVLATTASWPVLSVISLFGGIFIIIMVAIRLILWRYHSKTVELFFDTDKCILYSPVYETNPHDGSQYSYENNIIYRLELSLPIKTKLKM